MIKKSKNEYILDVKRPIIELFIRGFKRLTVEAVALKSNMGKIFNF